MRRRRQRRPAKNPYIFNGDGAMTLNFIKADKTADFEMVMGKLKEALPKSDKPARKQQAAGWKIFKAAEAGPNGSVLYVSIVDPAVKGADYTVSTILSEGFPDGSPGAVQEVLRRLRQSEPHQPDR